MIDRLLANKYHEPKAIVCKLVTIWASSIWSLICLIKPNAIEKTAYSHLADYIHEDVAAGILLTLSIFQLWWLLAHRPPFRFCSIGYAVQLAWWTAIFGYIVTDPGPTQITAITGISSVVLCALAAFISSPQGRGDATG